VILFFILVGLIVDLLIEVLGDFLNLSNNLILNLLLNNNNLILLDFFLDFDLLMNLSSLFPGNLHLLCTCLSNLLKRGLYQPRQLLTVMVDLVLSNHLELLLLHYLENVHQQIHL
jgi:hypothetical protein